MELRRWPFEPWGPIVRQTFVILNQVNRARKAAGLELIPTSCVRLKRRIYRPFEWADADDGPPDGATAACDGARAAGSLGSSSGAAAAPGTCASMSRA